MHNTRHTTHRQTQERLFFSYIHIDSGCGLSLHGLRVPSGTSSGLESSTVNSPQTRAGDFSEEGE